MKVSTLLLIPALAVAAACGGSGSTETSLPSGNADSVGQFAPLQSDDEIIALVYDNLYSVPDGFFVDERADTDRSYTIHHVLDVSFSYEVCTDDYADAVALEDEDNASRSVQGYYVTSYENERYFEFVRELSYEHDVGNIDDVTSPGFSRIFKCNNTNRNGVDRSLLTGYAGTLNAAALDVESVRVFAEYLWQFTFFPNSRKKVIGSYAQQSNAALQQTLQLAFASNQGSGTCDLIELTNWHFSADRLSGVVSQRFETVRSFEAKFEGGTAIICD